MRKLIVCNFSTVDGFYEDQHHDIGSLFEHYHPDYHGDNHFDFYNAGRRPDDSVCNRIRAALDAETRSPPCHSLAATPCGFF